MDQQMREFRVTSCWFGVEEVERRRFVKLKRCGDRNESDHAINGGGAAAEGRRPTLKAMVALSTKKAQGFGVQLGLLLKGVHKLPLENSTALPFLRILTTKSVGTFLAEEISDRVESVKNKKLSGGTEKVGATKVKRFEELCTKADAFVQPAVKSKCTTIGKAVVRPTVPIQMMRPPKRKLILLEDSDSDDPKPMSKSARLRDFMSSIHSVKLQSQELISSSKSDCNKRMTSLEVSVEDLRQSHMSLVNKQWRKHLYFLRRGDKLKADLSLEITATRMLLQNQSAEVNSSLASLSSQLAEVVAHLKRAGDVKKGEGGNSSSKKKVKVAVEESADGSESSF
ncbi:hypothetical protein F511_05118 [Dorcoceras hygrometricum]|uniref:Uncharacterized protein n=1 Tax=Dorcoceras hygrometricum TaxID=472368 RepID=A0A2Z7AP29_9LAMI|nr:hypothetical protein F511_05118 [Dorcoceras hygrometricum]